ESQNRSFYALHSRYDEVESSPLTGSRRAIMTDDDRWRAVVRRDADGAFFYSVRTTGVYCKPACPARLPRRENVAFHATAQDAERAGFRPCKRCRPNGAPLAERQAGLVEQACRMIEQADEAPSLDA